MRVSRGKGGITGLASLKMGFLNLAGVTIILVFTACSTPPSTAPLPTRTLAIPTLTPVPTQSPTRTPPPPTPTIPPEWVDALPGLEIRAMTLSLPGTPAPVEIILTRIDPARFMVKIHYDPENPTAVSEWQQRLGAVAVINGGFFNED